MGNELKEIAERFSRYSGDGWEIIHADKLANGGWELTVKREENLQETEHDRNV